MSATAPPEPTEAPDELLAGEPQLVGVGPVEALDGPVALTFDWGSSPCRVPVEMITEDDDPGAAVTMVESENSVVWLESVDVGWRYSREVTGAQSLVPAGPAYGPTVLDTKNEFIPVMMLDDRGRLLEATPSVEDAQDFVVDNIEHIAITELGRTMLPWVWVWTDLGSVDQEPRRDISSEPLGEVEVTSWALGRYADGAIHAFVVRESAATDGAVSGADDGLLDVRLVVEAVIDPSTLQPYEVRAERLLLRDGSGEIVARELSVTAFDWANAEGCE